MCKNKKNKRSLLWCIFQVLCHNFLNSSEDWSRSSSVHTGGLFWSHQVHSFPESDDVIRLQVAAPWKQHHGGCAEVLPAPLPAPCQTSAHTRIQGEKQMTFERELCSCLILAPLSGDMYRFSAVLMTLTSIPRSQGSLEDFFFHSCMNMSSKYLLLLQCEPCRSGSE